MFNIKNQPTNYDQNSYIKKKIKLVYKGKISTNKGRPWPHEFRSTKISLSILTNNIRNESYIPVSFAHA